MATDSYFRRCILVVLGFLFIASVYAAAPISHSASQITFNGNQNLQTAISNNDFSQWKGATGGINYPTGNVGIGVTSPGAKLDIAGNVKATGFCIGANCFSAGTPPDSIYYGSSSVLVGIGTNNPQVTLDVNGWIQSRSRVIGVGFYDINDQNYYLAPSQTSQLNYISAESFQSRTDANYKITPSGISRIATLNVDSGIGGGQILTLKGNVNGDGNYMQFNLYDLPSNRAYIGFPGEGSIHLKISNEIPFGGVILDDDTYIGNINFQISNTDGLLNFRSPGGYYWYGNLGTNIIGKLNDVEGFWPLVTQSGSTSVCRTGSPGFLAICSSLREQKKSIEPLELGLETINELRPVEFTWKSNNLRDLGFIAEEVEAVNPILAEYGDEGELQGVKYRQMTALLTKAVQEQQDQIEELQRTICSLKPSAEFC